MPPGRVERTAAVRRYRKVTVMKKIRIVFFCFFIVIAGAAIMLFRHWDRLRSVLYLAGCQVSPISQSTLPGVGRFSIVHLACDQGEKSEYIDVYASDNGVNLNHWWADHGTLLFRYDPSPQSNQLPVITTSGKTQIVISVPDVSSVAIKVDKWRGMNVHYVIGHSDYP